MNIFTLRIIFLYYITKFSVENLTNIDKIYYNKFKNYSYISIETKFLMERSDMLRKKSKTAVSILLLLIVFLLGFKAHKEKIIKEFCVSNAQIVVRQNEPIYDNTKTIMLDTHETFYYLKEEICSQYIAVLYQGYNKLNDNLTPENKPVIKYFLVQFKDPSIKENLEVNMNVKEITEDDMMKDKELSKRHKKTMSSDNLTKKLNEKEKRYK